MDRYVMFFMFIVDSLAKPRAFFNSTRRPVGSFQEVSNIYIKLA